MKSFLAILTGVLFTLAAFASGVVTAVVLFSAEPIPDRAPSDTAGLWTTDAVAVDTASQDFERLPARPVQQAAAQVEEVSVENEQPVDMITTASVEPQSETAPALDIAHLEWCTARYRSYNASDNTYRPYSGGRRECISPYTGLQVAASEEGARPQREEEFSFVGSAYAGGPALDYLPDDHVQSCFARYRSYRPEDNSYQPYGGGSRRQCE